MFQLGSIECSKKVKRKVQGEKSELEMQAVPPTMTTMIQT